MSLLELFSFKLSFPCLVVYFIVVFISHSYFSCCYFHTRYFIFALILLFQNVPILGVSNMCIIFDVQIYKADCCIKFIDTFLVCLKYFCNKQASVVVAEPTTKSVTNKGCKGPYLVTFLEVPKMINRYWTMSGNLNYPIWIITAPQNPLLSAN